MSYSTRKMRDYQAKRRGSTPWKSQLEDAAVLAAVAAGEVTESLAARTLGVDLFDLRGRRNALIALGLKQCGVPGDREPTGDPS